ncbi:MAG: DinB family protein [Candidatus Eisenbacteria bacterium]|nr:DinB family protein [Candidatus Eisenbacteria bacterium]
MIQAREFLKREATDAYDVTDRLFAMLEPADLSWKPPAGANWMTVGQLLRHCTEACGVPIRGFVTGDWGMPDGRKIEDLPPEEMLPSAERLPSVSSLEEAHRLLAADRAVTLRSLDEVGESDLTAKKMAPPWGGPERTLFEHCCHMVAHLTQHKGQLFYYLKLMGRNVGTEHLWGA